MVVVMVMDPMVVVAVVVAVVVLELVADDGGFGNGPVGGGDSGRSVR